MVFPDLLKEQESCAFRVDSSMHRDEVHADNPNTTQTPEYTKDKYNVKIIKRKGSLLRSHQQPT
jgi:hypothetical protein